MIVKRTFDVTIKHVREYNQADYPSVEETQARSSASTSESEDFDPIFAGGLIHTVIKFLEENGVDSLRSLCEAIESLGSVSNDDGEATVFMGELYHAAQKILHDEE